MKGSYRTQRDVGPIDVEQPMYERATIAVGTSQVVFWETQKAQANLIKIFKFNLHLTGEVSSHTILHLAELRVKLCDQLVLQLPIAEMTCKLGEFREGQPTRFYYPLIIPIVINPYESLTCSLNYLGIAAEPYEIYFSCSAAQRLAR